MHASWITLCRVVIVVSLGCSVVGWLVCAKIQAEAANQPQQAQGEYVHALPVKRTTHYITADQHAKLTVWRTVIMGSWVFALGGFIALGALDDARRHSHKLLEPF